LENDHGIELPRNSWTCSYIKNIHSLMSAVGPFLQFATADEGLQFVALGLFTHVMAVLLDSVFLGFIGT
jgi:hypothetical protein